MMIFVFLVILTVYCGFFCLELIGFSSLCFYLFERFFGTFGCYVCGLFIFYQQEV